MKIKVFALNKNNKVELTEKELKELLDDAYWEGYRDNSRYFTWQSPTVYPAYEQYKWNITTSDSTDEKITVNSKTKGGSSTYINEVTLPNGVGAVMVSDDSDYGMGNWA